MKMTKILWAAVPVVFLVAVVAAQWGTRAKGKQEVKMLQIVVKADATRPDDAERARRKIEEIYQELQKGADFRQLAFKSSEAETAQFKGDLGWIGKGILPKRLEDVAFGLRPGQYSGIIADISPELHIYRILYVEDRHNY